MINIDAVLHNSIAPVYSLWVSTLRSFPPLVKELCVLWASLVTMAACNMVALVHIDFSISREFVSFLICVDRLS